MAAPTESKNFSALTALAVAPATNDEVFISDTSEAVATDKPKRITVANLHSGLLTDVVNDTTPQLGGDLDVNAHSLVSASNGNIPITPNGTGKAVVTNLEAALPINAQTGTTYAPVLADADKLITLSNASPITCTIPANASVAFPVGTKLNFMQLGAGAATIAITSDTLSKQATLTAVLNGQYAIATAIKIASTQWVLFGDLVFA